ncbi:hypothetical protein [Shewanella sp. DAU305]|uniref:hypothetical protein n=1 Tax=Shewanella sp. DAU305 TaxID=2991940 RepID=UPI002284B189|nr:hypothetical protein [Shewanella sp. DAU305]WAL78737.1 hypothetical protein OX890_00820 [Shewanella sp. DAU305]
MELILNLDNFLNLDFLKVLSSVVGMIGGFLGFFVFFDNYILKFKPRLNISNRLFFRYKTEEKHPTIKGRSLESLILKIEAINGRNKIGRIDDFAVRVYDSRATLPSGYMLYAENVLERLPSISSSFEKDEFHSFSPVSILGRSTKNIVIEFKTEKYMGAAINPEGSLKMDLLYYLPKKGWRTVGTFSPYYFKGNNSQEDPNGIIEYSLLDNAVIRKEATKSLKQPEIGIYNGISGKYIGFYLMKPVWFLKRMATYPIKVIQLMGALMEALIRQVSSYCIVLPLIKLKSKTLPRMQFGNPRSHLVGDTTATLEKCKNNIEKIAEKINSKADSKAKITIRNENSGFSVQRGGLEVKFYKSGDGHIRAIDTGGYPQMFTFSMELVEYPFGLRLWKVNNKIMTVKSACIHVIDSFILLAH